MERSSRRYDTLRVSMVAAIKYDPVGEAKCLPQSPVSRGGHTVMRCALCLCVIRRRFARVTVDVLFAMSGIACKRRQRRICFPFPLVLICVHHPVSCCGDSNCGAPAVATIVSACHSAAGSIARCVPGGASAPVWSSSWVYHHICVHCQLDHTMCGIC